MKKAGSKKVILIGIIIIAVILLTFAFSQKLTIRKFTDKTDKVSGEVKIMVLSDLHDTYYGNKQQGLTEIIEAEKPDIILFAGDIYDDKKETGAANVLFEAVGEDYPCYYVTGNHEIYSGKIDELKKTIKEYGVTVLDGGGDVVMVDNQYIRICGVDDPAIGEDGWKKQISDCDAYSGDNLYSVLLTHRPERINRYHGYDLVVSGHTHGGIANLPGVLNGLYAPHQGWFPEFSGGEYNFDDMKMIVSRGLTKTPFSRFFNPPEVDIITVSGK